MSGPRYFLDHRPAGIALRDRDADPDGTMQWGEHAPGVIRIEVAKAQDDGSLAVPPSEIARLERQCDELNGGDLPSIRWANGRLAEGAKFREQKARAAREYAHQQAVWSWQGALDAACRDVMRRYGCREIERYGHGHEATLQAHIGPGGPNRSRWGGSDGLAVVVVGLANATVSFEVERDDMAGLEALAEHLPALTGLVRDLLAVCAEHFKIRPEAP